MLSAIVTLILLQAVSLASATVAKAPYPEMALAVKDPASVLVAPKRSSPQAVNPNFVSSDSTYWLVDYTYSGASCTSNVVLKFGVATGYCFDTSASSSLKYTCTSVTSCTVTIYNSDATCSGASNVIPFNLGTCTSTDANDDGYLTDDGAVFTKQQTLAVQGYPSGFSDANSGVMSFYESQTCMQSSMFVYRIGYENHCYSNYDGTEYTSEKYTNPTLYSYTGTGCRGLNIVDTTAAPSGACLINDATSSQKMTYYKKSSSNGLSAGAIAGIVIGTVAGVAIIAALVYFLVFSKAKAPMSQQSAAGANNL